MKKKTRKVWACGSGHTDTKADIRIDGARAVRVCRECGRVALLLGCFERDVYIHGNVTIGKGTSICGPCDINGNASSITIGDNCDIAAFTAINCADSHLRCLGLSQEITRKPIVIEDHVFVGTHSAILGGSRIGHHSVIAAGCIVRGIEVPPLSLVVPAALTALASIKSGVCVYPGWYSDRPLANYPAIYPPGA